MDNADGTAGRLFGARGVRLVLIALLVVGAAVFLWRGPLRGGGASQHDFALIYSSARAWLVGLDPYTNDSVRQAWLDAAGTVDRDPMGGRESNVLLYPPGAFVVLAPVAAMPWPAARVVWAVLNTVLFAASIWLVARVAWPGWGGWGARASAADAGVRGLGPLAFCALAVWFAPGSTNAALGQTAVLSMVLICSAQMLRERRQQAAGGSAGAGVLLGIATALKPQMSLLFVIYDAGRLRWKSAAAALVVTALIVAAGALRMQAAGVDWLASWQRNLSAFTAVADGDPTRANPLRFHILNLHYPLHNFTDDRMLVSIAVTAILGALSLAYFIIDLQRGGRRGEGGGELLSLSMVSVVTLLIVYHRFYDAVLLLFPLALALRGLTGGGGRGLKRWHHVVTLVLVGVFFVPGSAMMYRASAAGWAPAWLTESRVWEMVLHPHQPIALLLLCVWLVVLRWLWPRADHIT